jgi:hypothetical protein
MLLRIQRVASHFSRLRSVGEGRPEVMECAVGNGTAGVGVCAQQVVTDSLRIHLISHVLTCDRIYELEVVILQTMIMYDM